VVGRSETGAALRRTSNAGTTRHPIGGFKHLYFGYGNSGSSRRSNSAQHHAVSDS
jgi:hypothetical protein